MHTSIADELIGRLVTAAASIRTGDPLLEETQMGPLVSAQQRTKVLAAIERATSEGNATLLLGGTAPPDGLASAGIEGGYYVRPTILREDPASYKLGSTGQSPYSVSWRDEIFGPVLSVATFETEEEAIALANDSPYGLGHAVMSSDVERCERVGARLDAGTVWHNCSQALWPSTPFGGWKQSGFGREWGAAGMREYVKHKTVTAARTPGYSWEAYGGGA